MARAAATGFWEQLAIALAPKMVLLACVALYAVIAGAQPEGVTQAERPAPDDIHAAVVEDHGPAWLPSYAARFPGCMSTQHWDRVQIPTAVVVLRRSGDPVRMGLDDVFHRAGNRNRADDVWTVGVCH